MHADIVNKSLESTKMQRALEEEGVSKDSIPLTSSLIVTKVMKYLILSPYTVI